MMTMMKKIPLNAKLTTFQLFGVLSFFGCGGEPDVQIKAGPKLTNLTSNESKLSQLAAEEAELSKISKEETELTSLAGKEPKISKAVYNQDDEESRSAKRAKYLLELKKCGLHSESEKREDIYT